MSIDCIESLGDVSGTENWPSNIFTPLWNGRAIQHIETRDAQYGLICQFFAKAFEHIQELKVSLLNVERRDFLDLGEEIDDDVESGLSCTIQNSFAFARPSRPDFVLADSSYCDAEIIGCKSLLKTAVKGVKKCSKKVSKKVKKAAEKVAHFVKEHKTEILIGIAVAAALTGAYFISGALVAGTGAAQAPDGSGRKREDEDEPQSIDPELKTITDKHLTAHAQVEHYPQVNVSPQSAPPSEILLPPSNPIKSAITGFVDSIQRGVRALLSHFSSEKTSTEHAQVMPEPNKSCLIKTEGVKKPGVQIGFINGMNTSLSESMNHMEHVRQFVGDLHVEGVYNHSNTPPVDMAEIFLLNYAGIAPNTGKLLVENWSRFHEENIHNPDAKYLQLTHSMGNILTKDALQMAPQEIRDRVIVAAIAPAVIIPQGLCHDSFHYASKKDVVHYGENAHTILMAAFNQEQDQSGMWNQLRDNKERLIILEPCANAEGLDHDFESGTFGKTFKDHITEYLSKRAEAE